MHKPSFILGYHGCDKEVGRRLLHNEISLLPSENPYDWLGHGAYFWENDHDRALQWAHFLKERDKIRTPFVIGAIIDLGFCMDLTEISHTIQLKEAYQEFRQFYDEKKIPMPVNERGSTDDEDLILRKLDCAVINIMHTLRKKRNQPPYDTVRGIFQEGGAVYENARIREKTHVQLCVRNPRKSIVGYFLPIYGK